MRSEHAPRVGLLACVAFTSLAFLMAAFGAHQVSMLGFPDGHLTPFERASAGPLTLINGAFLMLGLYGVALCHPRVSSARKRAHLLGAFALLLLLLLGAHLAVPWYFLEHLGLDHGRGG